MAVKPGWKREMELLYNDDVGKEPSQADWFLKCAIHLMVEAFQNLKGQEAGDCREKSKEQVEEPACEGSMSPALGTSADIEISAERATTTLATPFWVIPAGVNPQGAGGRGVPQPERKTHPLGARFDGDPQQL